MLRSPSLMVFARMVSLHIATSPLAHLAATFGSFQVMVKVDKPVLRSVETLRIFLKYW